MPQTKNPPLGNSVVIDWVQIKSFLNPPDQSSNMLPAGDQVNTYVQLFRTFLVGLCALFSMALIVVTELDSYLSGQHRHYLISTATGVAFVFCAVLLYQCITTKRASLGMSNAYLMVAFAVMTIAAYIKGTLPLMFFTAIMAFTYLIKPPGKAFITSIGMFAVVSVAMGFGLAEVSRAIYIRLVADFAICLSVWHLHLCLMSYIMRLYKHSLRTRTKFLDSMSHELRTPLNGLNGLTYLLSDQLKNQAANQNIKAIGYTDQMLAIQSRLSDIVETAIDLNHAEEGSLTVSPRHANIPALCAEVIQQFKPAFVSKGLSLTMRHQDVPEYAMVDDRRIKQMLHVLLSRALQQTEEGGVSMKAASRFRDGETVTLTFEICDSSTGVVENSNFNDDSEQASDHVGESFQLPGMGLTLIKALTAAHGGDCGYFVKPGKGCCFWFEVSAKLSTSTEAATKLKKQTVAYDFTGMNILVCDDEPINRFVVEHLLGKRGATLHMAENGKKAEELARSMKAPCDLILMDLMMPVVDGFEAIENIREIPSWKKVPALCVSAVLDSTDTIERVNQLFDDMIAKPFDSETLLAKVTYFKLKRELGLSLNNAVK